MTHVGLVAHYGDDSAFSIKESELVAAQGREIMKIQTDKQAIRTDMESIPGFAQLDQLGARSWYPGKTYTGIIGRAQEELRSRTCADYESLSHRRPCRDRKTILGDKSLGISGLLL